MGVNGAGVNMKRTNIIIAAVAIVAVLVVAALLIAFVPQTSAKTIKYTDVPPVNQQAYIQQGLIDGGVSWEPYDSDSISNGTGHALLWSSDIWPNHPCCVVVVDNDFLTSNLQAALGVMKAHIEANKWIAQTIANRNTTEGQANYSLLLNLGASFSNRNTTVVAMSLEHMTLDYNITEQQVNYLKTFVQSYIDSGLIKQETIPNVDAFVNNLVNTSYLTQADALQPVAAGSALTTVRLGYLNGDLHQFARVVAESAAVGNLLGLGDRTLFNAYGVQTQAPSGMPGSGYANGGAVMTGFAAKNVDVGYLGAPPTLLNVANQNVNVKIVSLANSEGSALVVKNSITSIDQLNGLKIGEPGISSIQYLLLLEIAKKYGYQVVKA
jgi:ABC-type taurine transport system substrate-binding protein